MRIYSGGILTETNTFSPLPVGLPAFERQQILRGEYRLTEPSAAGAVTWALQQRAEQAGWSLVTGLCADAEPGAAVVRAAYEALRDEMLAEIRRALPLDAVALNLHGGMVAQGYDDCEGDLLARVRAVVGPDAVIGALFDPHSHLSPAMVESADLLVFYKENPHTDIQARAGDLVTLIERTVRGEIRPDISTYDCRLLDVFQTNREPMRSFVAELRALEGRDGVLDVSVVHGFRRADVPIIGAKIVVITDGQRERGNALAADIGRRLIAIRGTAAAGHVALDDAVRHVASAPRAPVLLADMADNPGGGSPGDSTYVTRALLEAGVDDFALGILWDPVAVRIAFEAGEGARLPMRIGGKACRLSGVPLDLDVRVGRLLVDAHQLIGGTRVAMGRVAALHAGRIDVLVGETRTQTYGANLFGECGIDLRAKRAIVVKSAQHYRAEFLPFFAEDIVLDAPGVCTAEIRRLKFERIPRPIWPFDENPWQETA